MTTRRLVLWPSLHWNQGIASQKLRARRFESTQSEAAIYASDNMFVRSVDGGLRFTAKSQRATGQAWSSLFDKATRMSMLAGLPQWWGLCSFDWARWLLTKLPCEKHCRQDFQLSEKKQLTLCTGHVAFVRSTLMRHDILQTGRYWIQLLLLPKYMEISYDIYFVRPSERRDKWMSMSFEISWSLQNRKTTDGVRGPQLSY